ncbi:hypothetical protein IC229_28980 [Spirosoma sp. BT702]|uniref:Uncharacterized protein n=1 Tax=Spirosoma profusum TaxID=2771354 RepID=A0A927AUL5_9BACT|nr:hypothetical protein [Spirosoma profusum]MBD2704705.1 hypothetical protein [Spirosoma profusum]
MPRVDIDNWEGYVSDFVGCNDPIGYLSATNDAIGDIEQILQGSPDFENLTYKLTAFIEERKKFTEYGFDYMNTGKFDKFIDPRDRHRFPALGR